MRQRYLRLQRLRALCRQNGLRLALAPNWDGVDVLEDVFHARTYALAFPFYTRARILDIGAHKGYFSLFAAQHVEDGSVIEAYEPSPANLDVLAANLVRNGVTMVRPHAAAVGAHAGRGTLVEAASVNHEVRADGDGAVSVVAFADALAALPGGAADFVKMDCEGAEYPILLESPADVVRRAGAYSIEFHDTGTAAHSGPALRNRLAGLGFDVRHFGYGITRQNRNYGMLVAVQPDWPGWEA